MSDPSTEDTMGDRAKAFLTEAAEEGRRVMTRRWSGDSIKHRRVYRDGRGFYFRWGRGGACRAEIAKAATVDGEEWFYEAHPKGDGR